MFQDSGIGNKNNEDIMIFDSVPPSTIRSPRMSHSDKSFESSDSNSNSKPKAPFDMLRAD